MSATAMGPGQKSRIRPWSYSGLLVSAFFAATPVILFYSILLRKVLNIPFLDDYEALLGFVNHLVQLNGFSSKASYFLASQHNEYKLLFENAVVWLQFDLLGHVNFVALCEIGNAFVLLLALLLWKMFLPSSKDLHRRLALFVPVLWLLFQLQYHGTLNWAMAGLQNLPILVFSFATLCLLWQTTRKAFCGALICFALAIASSGNGFLLLPIGLLILAVGRRYARIGVWLVAAAGCIAVYSYHYKVTLSQSVPHQSLFSKLTRLQPVYAIGFMGSAASIPFPPASFVLGTSLCLFFVWMVYRGYIRRNPLVSSCVLFLLLTAVGVAGIRSDLGLIQSVSSRYTIYSALFLIFAWFMVVEEFLQNSRTSLLNNGVYLGAVAAAVFFCLFMDAVNLDVINNWNGSLLEGMADFEHPSSPESTRGPAIPLWKGDVGAEPFNVRARAVLIESIRLGTYKPPAFEPISVREAESR